MGLIEAYTKAVTRTSTYLWNKQKVAGRWEAHGKHLGNTSLSFAPNDISSRLQRSSARYKRRSVVGHLQRQIRVSNLWKKVVSRV